MSLPKITCHAYGRKARKGSPGFALVVSVMMLVLLVLLAVGLLSLSSIAIRTSSLGSEHQQARTNARLALMMAMGELQTQAGPDTRITATADILDADNPPLLGVWRSWEGSDHDASGRPLAPDYNSKKQSVASGGRFLRWLVSSSPTQSDLADAVDLVYTTPQANTIPLLSSGSLDPADTRQVHVKPTPVDSKGRIAWWVSPENQKACLKKPQGDSNDPNEWAQRQQSHAISDPEPFGLDAVLAAPELCDKTFSLRSTDLIGPGMASRSFHDLSTVSMGLLTNSATGGWRKDLSLLMNHWDQQPANDLPLFRIKPDGDGTSVDRATAANPTPDQGALYPWSAYRPFSDNVFSQQAAASSWSHLADWMNLYQSMSVDANGRTSLPLSSDANALDQANTFVCLHKQRVYPLIARIQWVFYHYSTSRNLFGNGNFLGSGRKRLHLMVMPVVTIWNPYNVAIAVDNSMYVKVIEPIPPAIRYSFDNSLDPDDATRFDYIQNAKFSAVMESSDPAANAVTGYNYDMEFERSKATYTRMYFQVKGPMSFGPGQSSVFSPSTSAIRGPNDKMVELGPGIRLNPLYSMKVYWVGIPKTSENDRRQYWTNNGMPPTTRVRTTVVFDNALSIEGKIGTGVGIDILAGEELDSVDDADTELDEVRNQMRGVYERDTAAKVMSPVLDESEMQSVTLAEVHENATPFMSMIFGLRTANSGLLPSKGLVQSSPFTNSSRMGFENFVGSGHPINSSYDFSYALHPPGGDSLLPEISDGGSGFIVSGINSADGLTRCVISEIPSRPVASLVELSNWDLRFENPYPPYAFNLIGNSDASPLIPSNAIHNGAANASSNLQHDDSYCANHLLFDDWFVSAIAPTTGTSPGGARSEQQVFTDHLSGTQPLASSAYQPMVADRTTSSAAAQAVYDAEVAPVDAWKTIASRLEVEGMFNVNSTSVQAWRSLLGHARGQKIPYLDASGQATLSADTDYGFSRLAVSSDAQAGTNSGLSGSFPEASEFTGYRVFDDAMLDLLAEEIVNQVRQRGPFLSLSEFVNRQLSNDSLAMAGAVQTALNHLQQSANNPFTTLEAQSTSTDADPTDADEEYQYPEAAVGYSTYGVPGWTRQADILRPLAPILSVRDDTFTIRAYGDALDKNGNVTARAYCEAVVQRTRDYVDSEDAADRFDAPQSPTNLRFGRKFKMVSFRWLSDSEV